jgi:hypothetical protein
MSADGTVKIVDFGLAKLLRNSSNGLLLLDASSSVGAVYDRAFLDHLAKTKRKTRAHKTAPTEEVA